MSVVTRHKFRGFEDNQWFHLVFPVFSWSHGYRQIQATKPFVIGITSNSVPYDVRLQQQV